MGCGKSSLGKLLAASLKMELVDSDLFIEQKCGLNISSIFELFGEAHFRKLEKDFISLFSSRSGFVISTGGGMSVFNDLKDLGYVIFLDSSFEAIKARVKNDSKRPLFKDPKKAKELFLQRYESYKKNANLIVNSDSKLSNVLECILDSLHKKNIINGKNYKAR